MKVSVIIPAYNRERFIGSTLRSLLRQRDAADLDIVVIDDGSTDGTADVVNGFIEQASCIRLIRQSNRGISGARNAGLDNIAADADLVTFLDSDDISIADHFSTIVPLFRADPNLTLTYSLITIASDVDDDELTPAPHALTCTVRGIHLVAGVFRRDTILSLGRFDESLRQSEDLDFLLRFFGQPQKHIMLDNVSAIYRRHAGSVTRNKPELRRSLAKVLLSYTQKRRRDPTLGDIPKFFNFEPLLDDRYASLR